MPTVKLLSDTEYRRLNDWMITDMPNYFQPHKYIRNLVIIYLMLDCGLRVGEVAKLKWDYFRKLTDPSGFLSIPGIITKSKKGRDIPLPVTLFESLSLYAKHCKELNPQNVSKFLFPRAVSGDHMTTRNIQFIVRFIGLAALNKEIHCHMLRHTFATRLLRVTNIRIVQELMGHSKLNSTQIYTHPNANDLRTAIDKMSNTGKGCDRHEL